MKQGGPGGFGVLWIYRGPMEHWGSQRYPRVLKGAGVLGASMGYGCVCGTWGHLWVPGMLYVWVLGSSVDAVGIWLLWGSSMDPAGHLLVLEMSMGSESICRFQGDLEVSVLSRGI